ncbi:cytochrome P450 [Mycobacteroides abscessus]|uniref:cytochrome P450 n=1 Tax=Mycobacteroides abscessus TaxID=36809 RepID=UPI00195065D4|nr:cytochrome P450 [Mycobacteroides abscessus]
MTVDLTDVDLFVDGKHFEVFAGLRKSAPIYFNDSATGTGFWALTTYDDVSWAYRDHETFGSTRGAILGGSFSSAEDTASGRMLVASDLPRHRLLKNQILPAISAEVTAAVSAQVRELVNKAVANAIADGGCDFATDVATALPAGALMVIMGIGQDEAYELIGMTRRMVGFQDEVFVDTGGDVRLRLAWLQAEIFEFFADIITERRKRPGTDLVSRLLTAEINGHPFTEEEVLYNCMNVAVGGNETSSYTACTGLLAFLEHPEQYDLLAHNRVPLDSAIAEILRYSSTNAYVQRMARHDIRRRDVHIREGDSVTLWNASANRDEAQFPNAAAFDVARSPNRHLAYGAGIHRCIGAHIAQVELSLVFECILNSGVRFRLAGTPRRLRSNFILGLTSLPITVES